MAVVLMDNGAQAQYWNYRAAIPYRGGRTSYQPVSNSINTGSRQTYYVNPWSTRSSGYRSKPVQYKWKIDWDDSVEDYSDSRESSEVYRYYRRF